MDKELLRIVIIGTGLLIVVGMILWSYIKNRQALAEQDVLEHEAVIGGSGKISDALKIHHENDEFDVIPIGNARDNLVGDEESDWDISIGKDFDLNDLRTERFVLPDIIQFFVVANSDLGFNGNDIKTALERSQLVYGDLRVYERINPNGDIDYGVACMVEPGTFPQGDALVDFYCPGVVFYLQHLVLEDAQGVFDDFVETIKAVANELDGDIWDHHREPLTEATVQMIRQHL